MTTNIFFPCYIALVMSCFVPAYAENPPRLQLDRAISDCMKTTGATAASVAVVFNGRLVYSRGYGWSDQAKQQPTAPDNTFRIASNSKPITAAMVKQLIRANKFSASTRVFQYLSLKPFNGKVGDRRLNNVTVGHLLEHRGGWDREKAYDPMYRLGPIRKTMKIETGFTTSNIIEYMLAQKLQFDPGTKRAYSNFGYLILGRVVEKATGKKYSDALQEMICKPLEVSDIRVSANEPEKRHPKEVFYPKETGRDMTLRDCCGGLMASTTSLCLFMQKYWISGEERIRSQNYRYVHFGSLPNSTTALMEQRPDGIDYAVLLNSRRNRHFNTDNRDLRIAINQAIDQIKLSGR